MKKQICLWVCDTLAHEISITLQTGGHIDVNLVSFQERCNCKSFNIETINALIAQQKEEYQKYLFLGSSCLSNISHKYLLNHKVKIIPFEQCFELLLNKETIAHYIRQGYYIVTPGWLRHHQRHIADWGFDESTAKIFFGESMRKILLLDTELTSNYTKELDTLSEYMGLPYEVLPVGLSHCQMFIDNIILREREDIERHLINIQLSQLTRESADYSVLFNQLKGLVNYTSETEIINDVFCLIDILFAPQEISFCRYIEGKIQETVFLKYKGHEPKAEEGNSFNIKLSHQGENLGEFNIYQIKFPAFMQEYKKMGEIISQFCSLALANAGKFKVIMEQQQQLSQYNKNLKLLNQSKDKFFSIIAHDLRSPFNGFIGVTELMTDENLTTSSEELRTLAKKLHNSALAIYNLLENLLKWSQIQTGILQPELKTLSVKSLLAGEVVLLTRMAKKKNIQISIYVPENLFINADEKMMGSIIRNLVNNAIKFTGHNGKVTIKAENYDEQYVIIQVSDTGIGMDAETMSKIFRIDVNKGRLGTEGEPSSGLGLTLCKEFVEKHGGKIWTESSPGQGCCFKLTIPRANITI